MSYGFLTDVLRMSYGYLAVSYIWARPSGNGGTLLLYFAPVLLLYSRLSKITTGTI